ncbi:MAG: Ig-like domain-containing protein [Candidatus Omnitrophica bacterium]|nr:Ig-like domain-containing protein [Candidatus Omnitrophota bacterium]
MRKISGIILTLLSLLLVRNAYAEPLSAYISEVYPEYAANDIQATTDINITFNNEMEKKSVEKNFLIWPKTPGKFIWDKNKLTFRPYAPLWPSTAYLITLSDQVRDTRGFPLSIGYFTTSTQGLYVGKDAKIHIVSKNNQFDLPVTEGANPVWGPGNRSIIYEYNNGLWITDANGKNQTKLTEDLSLEYACADLAPQGRWLVFAGTNLAQVSNIYFLDLEENIQKQLTAFFEPGEIRQICWSPDGLYIAFLREGQIWVMSQDGTNLRKVNTPEAVCKENFSWSPGGTQIAFCGIENIWVGNIYSSELKKISFDDPKTGRLNWSTNNRIVFEAEGLTTMDADGGNELNIPTAARMPQWINSGKYFSCILPLHNKNNEAQLWIFSAEGAIKKKLAIIDINSPNVSWSKNIDLTSSPFP